MFPVFHKWLFATCVILCCSGSFGKDEKDQNLMLVIQKISEDQLNLTCWAKGERKFEGLSLTGPDEDQSVGETIVETHKTIFLNDTLDLGVDLPPVFDQQWEDFTIKEPNDNFTLRANQSLWVSIRYKQDLAIHYKNDVKDLYVRCNNIEDGRWVHLQLRQNTTHLSIKSDMCTTEDTLNVISNEGYFRINSTYKLHQYDVLTITENDSKQTPSKHKNNSLRREQIKIETVDGDYIRLYYYLDCNSCTGSIRLEQLKTTTAGNKLNSGNLSVSTNYEWNSIELNNTNAEYKIDKIDVVFTMLYAIKSAATLIVRNIIIRKNHADHSISMTINPRDLSQYICESMESNVHVQHGTINSNETQLVSQFPQSKLCYSSGNCYCSAGSQGDMCEKPCRDGYYGNCSAECDCCNKENNCNKQNGTCIENENNCTETRSVKNITLQSFPTQITGNIFLEKDSLQQKINSIKIEFKRISESKWTKLEYEENLDNPYITINGLHPNTNYTVRTSLCVPLRCFDEYRKSIQISTTCEEPVSSDFKLDVKQHDVSIITSAYAPQLGSCPELVSISYENRAKTNKIIGLTAFTNYTINILFKGKVIENRTICTTQAKPGAVRDITFNDTNSVISWKEPKNPNGNLGPYFVNITRLGSIVCNKEPSDTLQMNTTNLPQISFKAVPYSEYKVFIQASNEEGRGHTADKIFQTSSKNEIDHNEEPIKFSINETHLEMEISSCDKVYGPWIIYESTFTCLDTNGEEKEPVSTINISYTHLSKYIKPLSISLEPFTNYSVQTSIYRNNASIGKLITRNIVTLAKCPPSVRNLDVYSVSNDSISVRWKLPDPPRGLLEKITFSFYNASGKTEKSIKEEKMKNCELWDDADYFCKTFDNLDETLFPIYVIAKNMNTTQCKENATINKMALQETASEAPTDLSATWKGDMEELELTWKHPNKTNGQLKHFNISLKSTTTETDSIEKVYTISSESLSYNYTVKDLAKARKYTVEVIPVNEVLGSPAKLEKEIITPPPYPVIDRNISYSIDGTDCKIYIPSIKNTTNSFMTVIMSNGECNSADGEATVGRKVMNISQDVFGKNVVVDLKKDFNITNITSYKDYSFQIVVTNEFEEIFRNTSICLTRETDVAIAYLLIGLIILIVLLAVCAGLIIYHFKYRPIKYLRICKKRSQNTTSPSRENSANDEYIPLTHVPRNDKVSYENQPLMPKSNAIQRKKFFKYLKNAVKYGEECALYTEFDSIPLKIYDFSEAAIKNKIKNRYLNILPYEENRVILKSGRYINASYIQGYKTEKAYIATQGPKIQTVDDFWEMVFENNVKLIAMLCPIKEGGNVKCDQYWPDFRNKILNSRDLQIQFDDEKNCGVYIERQFNIQCDGVNNKIVQLQFTAWMDHKIPSSSQFLQELLERFHSLHDYSSPAVVHCSAGAGRTGTLILCDYLLKMEADTSTLDFPLVLCNLRKERTQMVQTKQQYHLAHVVIYEYLCVGKNGVVCDDDFEKNVLKIIDSQDIIQKELTFLDNLNAIDVTTFNDKYVSIEAEDKAKNRDETILPTFSGIIYLEPSKQSNSNYINAINVDVYNLSEKLIVTQQPLISSHGSTLADYWRLVFQSKPEVIVSLQSQLVNFYPTENELLINKYIKLKCLKQEHSQLSTTFTIKIEMGNEDCTIKILQTNTKLKPTKEGMLQLINFYNEYRNNYKNIYRDNDRNHYSPNEKTVLVTCLNGCELSGIFVALDYTIEKMLQQEICDVFLAVRTVRKTRPNFITSEEQYRFLYRCALEIRKSMCTVYSNIS